MKHKHFIMDAPRFETPVETNGDSDTTKHIVLRTIEAIREIHGTLNIDNRRHHMIFKETLEKWASLQPPRNARLPIGHLQQHHRGLQ